MKYRYDTPCGLYCGACGAVLADKTGTVEELAKKWDMKPDQLVCHGCLTETVAVFCRDCTLRACVLEKGVEHCFECDDYPCDALVAFRNDKASHHSMVLHNSGRMREVGVKQWLEEQKERWSCPGCGRAFSWYETECEACGAALRGCRQEESELDPAE